MKQFVFVFLVSCLSNTWAQSLSIDQANRLVQLPLKCVEIEYPNKLNQVLNDSAELLSPKTLHPAFYGCFDWHSSVHGHWLMVKLLKKFPDLKEREKIINVLKENITKENIEIEIAYFNLKFNESFERTYGWAWLLKLQEELNSWDHNIAKELAKNLLPLSTLICEKYKQFLPKLMYPIRSGEHTNTAFGLAFAYDYAVFADDSSLLNQIVLSANKFYINDKNYPLHLEPSGYDFLSPTFSEIDLMRRILSEIEFLNWLKKFHKPLFNKKFKLVPGKVIDRTDGKLVHLDGLNFSRAWCMYELAKFNPKLKHLEAVADQHVVFSLGQIVDGDYMGEHWLASFAVYALSTKDN